MSAVGITMGRLKVATETAGMIDAAKRTIVLVDPSNFGVAASAQIAGFDGSSIASRPPRRAPRLRRF